MSRSLRLPLALAFITLGAAGWIADAFTFENSGRIWIEGTSTVHDWECEVEEFAGALNMDAQASALSALSSTSVAVPVQRIECNNGTMNGKLRKALGQAPIRYTLTSATPGAAGADGWFTVRTAGNLTIAGATRPVQMTVKGKALDDGRFRFTGQHALLMTDYGVDPPTALLGTLKTGDEVTVHFDVTASR